ncbi:M48 family metallopeptidase [Thalassotalea aquiviva]|uniref:M48 family metallopeptidase n=1 Tax=Thalassotalea aquiviva TaxID=3242415 RepID=UPI00352A9287
MNNVFKTLTCMFLLAGLTACGTSPTGRSQLLYHSDSDLNKMGAQSFDQMKQQVSISSDKKVNEFVQCVANYITPNVSSDVHSGDWEVVVFDSAQVNAFALPGGKIGVYTGILQVTENADQLAAIVGHEVAHVIARHSNERLSSNTLSQGVLMVAGTAMAVSDIDKDGLLLAGLGLGIQYGILMPYGRTHETEADIIGQELMAESGFDPKESVKLWQNMAKQSNGAPPEFLSTHPSNQTRIKNLTNNLKKTEPLYRQVAKKAQCVKPVIPEPKPASQPKG